MIVIDKPNDKKIIVNLIKDLMIVLVLHIPVYASFWVLSKLIISGTNLIAILTVSYTHLTLPTILLV